MADEIGIKDYIQVVGESSRRSRMIIVVLLTASVLAFVAFWNAVNWSWINIQINRYENSLRVLKKDPLPPHGDMGVRPEVWTFIEDVMKIPDVTVLDSTARGEYVKALETRLEGLLRIRGDKVWVMNISFFGVILHVNDLGLLGGFSFLIILLVLRFSLAREYDNLRYAFFIAYTTTDLAKKKQYYNLLSMKQVLGVPPKLVEGAQPTDAMLAVWGKITRIIIWLPILILLLIFINDCVTLEIGLGLSARRTYFGLAFNLVFLTLDIILVVVCTRILGDSSREWRLRAKEIMDTSGESA